MTTIHTLANLDQPRIVTLSGRTLLAIDERCSGTLRVDRGEAWVTCGDGGPDHLLRAGDRMAIGGGGTTAVSALACAAGDLVVGLEPGPQRTGGLRRRLGAWREALRAGVAPLPQG